MIAAGVNAKTVQTFMGHANISITLNRYGHLMPGSEEQAAELPDYLDAQGERAAERARDAAPRSPRDGGGTVRVRFSDPPRPEAPAKSSPAPRFQLSSHG